MDVAKCNFVSSTTTPLCIAGMQKRKEKNELELLRTSFELEDSPSSIPHMSLMNMVSNIDRQVGDDDDIIFDERALMGEGKEGQERKEMIKIALNDYINERLSAVSKEYQASQ